MIHVDQYGPVTCIRMARSFLGKPLYWTAAYWVDGLLIDSGPRCATPHLLRVLANVEVEQIVLTHGHEDHIGGLSALQKRYPQATIYASTRTLAMIEEPTRLKMQLYRRLLWGIPSAVKGVRPLDSVNNLLFTKHHTLRAVETPGHTPDHVSFFEPHQRWVFCGDAFIGGQDRAWSDESDLFGVLGALRTIDSLHPERLFPGSGNVRRAARHEVNDKINYLLWLTAEVARLDAEGLPLNQMISTLFKEESAIRFWTQGHFSAANLIEACRSYNSLLALPQAVDQPQPTTSSTALTSTTAHSPKALHKTETTDEESADLSDWFS